MTTKPNLDTEAARRIHFTDPRVRRLAYARWHLTTGGTHAEWLALGKDNPEALIWDARDWLRAAVAAGLLPPLEQPTGKPQNASPAAEPPCRCGHAKARHLDPPGTPVCMNCPEDGEGGWRHPYTPAATPARQAGTEDGTQ